MAKTRLKKLSKLFRQYNQTHDEKLPWPPTKETEKLLIAQTPIKPVREGYKSARGILYEEAKSIGYDLPYRTSKMADLRKYISSVQKFDPEPHVRGPWDITGLMSDKERFAKYLLSVGELKEKFGLKLRYANRTGAKYRFIALSDRFLKKVNNDDKFENFLNSHYRKQEVEGSDTEEVIRTLEKYDEAQLFRIKGKALRAGGFFPYKINQQYEENDNLTKLIANYHRYVNPDTDNSDGYLDCLGHAIRMSYPEKIQDYLIYRKTEPGTFLQSNRLGHLSKLLNLNIRMYRCGSLKDNRMRGSYTYKSNNEEDPYLNITTLDRHYFLYETTEFSTKDINELLKLNKQRETKKLSSFSFLKQLINKKFVVPFTPDECLQQNLTFKHPLPTINYKTENLLAGHVASAEDDNNKVKKNRETILPIYFDTETYPDKRGTFTVYQLVFSIPDREGNFQTFTLDSSTGFDSQYAILYKFFTFIYSFYRNFPAEERKNLRIVCLAHNLGFDISSILRFNHKGFHVKSRIGNSKSNTKCLDTSFYDCKIKFQDTYAFIPKKLSSFSDMFKLDTKKGPFPYSCMNKKVITRGKLSIRKALTDIPDEDRNRFLKAIHPFKISEAYFDVIQYSAEYCRIDVKLLQEGFESFRKMVNSEFGLEVLDVISTPSLAKKIISLDEDIKRVPHVSCSLRELISQTCVGGRTTLRDNKMHDCTSCELLDLDVTSLYPYAFTFLTDVPTSEPKIAPPTDNIYDDIVDLYDDLNIEKGSWLFGEVDILKIKNPRHIPSLSRIDKETLVRNWEDKPGVYMLNHVQLEDLCNFQNILFKFNGGVYYPKSKDDVSYREFFLNLFDKRHVYKEEGNPIQEVYKLLMNSQHGKMTQNPITSTEIFREVYDKESSERFDYFVAHNFQEIEEYRQLPSLEKDSDFSRYVIKKSKAVGSYQNQAQVASVMYAYSKRVMNQVIYLAEDNNMKVYYTDTDSMFLDKKNLTRLSKLYRKKYNRTLLGKGLGYFHSDFDVPETEDSNTYAKGIFLGKKSYFLKCRYTSKVNGKRETKNIERMKGIPASAIHQYYLANDSNMSELMTRLYNHEKVTFDLSTNQTRFEIDDNFKYKNKSDFLREVAF